MTAVPNVIFTHHFFAVCEVVCATLSIIFVNCHYDSYFFIVLSCLLQNCEGYNIDYSMFVDF